MKTNNAFEFIKFNMSETQNHVISVTIVLNLRRPLTKRAY